MSKKERKGCFYLFRKRIRIGLLCILLCVSTISLAGCQTEEARNEPTDELVIYTPYIEQSYWEQAVEKFERKYKIKVTQVNLDNEAYNERVINELNAGKGPDILFTSALDISTGGSMDLNKAMKNGSFLDLTSFMEQDEDFNANSYFNGIFEAGKYEGKQYILPVSLKCPLFYGSKEKFEELGMSLKDKIDMVSLLKEMNQAIPAAEGKSAFQQMMWCKTYFPAFYLYSGIECLNYETNTTELESSDLTEFLENYKEYYPYDYMAPGTTFTSDGISYSHILEDEYYIGQNADIAVLVMDLSFLKTEGGYEVFAVQDSQGGMAATYLKSVAINANSKNQVNAYNFIKILMSEEQQLLMGNCMPIRKSVVYYNLMKEQKASGNVEYDGYYATKLSDEEIAEIYDLLTGINTSRFYREGDIVEEVMKPYFSGEKSYSDCYEDLKERLTLYISE